MPREYVIVTRRAPDTDDLRAAAAEAGVAGASVARVNGGSLDIVRDAAGAPVLTFEYTRLVAVPDEVERLAPAAAAALPGPVFWTEGWSRAEGDVSLHIAAAVARRCGGVCVREDGTLV
jgi:hypothetical protein